jgi:outer membrane protein assembly factor BamB
VVSGTGVSFGNANNASTTVTLTGGAATIQANFTPISGAPQWVQTVTYGSSNSNFKSVATDATENVYAAGQIFGTGSYGFGNGVYATGTDSGSNIVIVKYNSSGTAQWAQTVTSGPNASQFNSAATDASGNVYAAGQILGTGSFGFGNGITAAGTFSNAHVLLVKYNSAGTAQWANTLTSGSDKSFFFSVATDASGNVYAAGEIWGTGSFGFGNGVTATGTASGRNIVLVKYNSMGTSLWAQTVTSGSSTSNFNSVAIDMSGSVYAAGFKYDTGILGFGNGVTAAGACSTGDNVLLVKYNSSGTAQWAQTVTSGSSISNFNYVTTDVPGNVYVVGYISGTGGYGFGNGVTAAGTYNGYNAVLVKYNSSGNAQWAQTVTSGSHISNYYSIATDASGNVYAAGTISGTGSYGFGNGITAVGTFGGNNIVLVKYNSSGTAQWAQTVTSGSSTSYFYSVAIDISGNVYATGYISGTGSFGFGYSVTAAATYGSSGQNVVLVKYFQ